MYIHDCFQEEYGEEGLDVASIPFRDNQKIIDLIAKRPAGLMPILEDQARCSLCVAEIVSAARPSGLAPVCVVVQDFHVAEGSAIPRRRCSLPFNGVRYLCVCMCGACWVTSMYLSHAAYHTPAITKAVFVWCGCMLSGRALDSAFT